MRGAYDRTCADDHDWARLRGPWPCLREFHNESPSAARHAGGSRNVPVCLELEDRFHQRPPFARLSAWRGLLKRFHQRFPFGDSRARRDVRGEAAPEIAAVSVDHHHEPPAEQVDLHLANAGAPQAAHHFGPYAIVVRFVGLDRCGIVAEIDGEYGSRHEDATTLCRAS